MEMSDGAARRIGSNIWFFCDEIVDKSKLYIRNSREIATDSDTSHSPTMDGFAMGIQFFMDNLTTFLREMEQGEE